MTGFLAFANGVIGAVGTGNDPYTSEGFPYPHTRLPGGRIPTAMAVTQNNEFVLVTVWNTSEKKGQLAVIAVLGHQNAQERRFYWGLAGGWPTVRGLKLLGFVDLPFAAPLAVDAAVDIALGNTRGHGDNVHDDLSVAAVRERWWNAPRNPGDWGKRTARFGYAIVSSRAEDKVAIVNLRPLLDYYRKMYLTTPERFLQTTQVGPGRNRWPFTFEEAPEQKPRVVALWTVRRPTAVSVGAARGSFIAPRSAGRDPLCSLKIAYVAAMDGGSAFMTWGPSSRRSRTRRSPALPSLFPGWAGTLPRSFTDTTRRPRMISSSYRGGTVLLRMLSGTERSAGSSGTAESGIRSIASSAWIRRGSGGRARAARFM